MSDLPSGGPLPDENEELPSDEIEEATDEDGQGAEDGETVTDDPDGEASGDEEDEERQTRDVAPRRTESRPARLRRENSELRERIARLEGAESARGRPQPQFDPGLAQRIEAQEQQFRESLEMMTPGQAALAVEQRANARIGMALQQMQAQNRDEIARTSFEAKAERNPVYGQFRDRVFQAIEAERRNGNWAVTYEAAFRYLVGEDAVRKAEQAGRRQSRQGAARVRAQTTRPTNGRGDAARGSRVEPDSRDADLARLRDAERRGIRFL